MCAVLESNDGHTRTAKLTPVGKNPHLLQDLMTRIFAEMPCVKVFVDNLVVRSPTEPVDWSHLDLVSKRLVKCNIRINVRKLDLNKRRISASSATSSTTVS